MPPAALPAQELREEVWIADPRHHQAGDTERNQRQDDPNAGNHPFRSRPQGIVVFGVRVLDEMVGAMDVIEEIVNEVKGYVRIIIDGGFRTGVDILKSLALGADFILIGRPIAIAAVGMGTKGVSFYLDTIRRELKRAMILTGSESISEISEDIVKRIYDNREVPEYAKN